MSSRGSDRVDSSEHAGRSFRAWGLFLLVVASGLLADLWTKSAVFERLMRANTWDAPHPVLPGVMNLRLSTNPGIVFGFDRIPPVFVVAASLVAVALVIVFFWVSPRKARTTHVALAMILAGALGNLYDRLFARVVLPNGQEITRRVRDFIDFSPIGYKYIFNVADVLLVVGVALLMLVTILGGRSEKPREAA